MTEVCPNRKVCLLLDGGAEEGGVPLEVWWFVEVIGGADRGMVAL